jgi:hypothetical protein
LLVRFEVSAALQIFMVLWAVAPFSILDVCSISEEHTASIIKDKVKRVEN